MNIIAIPATEQNFKAYGRFLRVKEGAGLLGEGWEAWMTDDVCLKSPANFGICHAAAVPSPIDTMQRYSQSEQMLLCSDQPIAILAAGNEDAIPSASDIRAFVLRPGDLAILGKGVWHSLGYGTQSDTIYYFLSADPNGYPAIQSASIPQVTLAV